MKKSITLAGAAAIAVAGTATADFTGVTFEALNLVDGHISYRMYANFDSPTDSMLAVSAASQALRFEADQPLYNDAVLPGSQLEDVLGALNNIGDSWVTAGGAVNADDATGTSDTQFSPDFLGGDGASSVINGSFFEQAENGGYFDSNPGTPENGGQVLIGQFTLSVDTTIATYQGSIDWQSAGAGFTSSDFSIVLVPAPGVAALLGLAAVAGGRRRRG